MNTKLQVVFSLRSQKKNTWPKPGVSEAEERLFLGSLFGGRLLGSSFLDWRFGFGGSFAGSLGGGSGGTFGSASQLALLAGYLVLVHDAFFSGFIQLAVSFAFQRAGVFSAAGDGLVYGLQGALQGALGFAVAHGSFGAGANTLLC
jgi:hypothetical protein